MSAPPPLWRFRRRMARPSGVRCRVARAARVYHRYWEIEQEIALGCSCFAAGAYPVSSPLWYRPLAPAGSLQNILYCIEFCITHGTALRPLRRHSVGDTKVIAFSIDAGLSDELTRGKRARAICISPLVCMMRTSRRRRQSTRAIRCGERETVTRPSMAQLAGQRGTCGAFTRCGTFWHVSCSSLEWTKDV
jgi:hypothetical protein